LLAIAIIAWAKVPNDDQLKPSDVIQLSDDNFEHLTQATSGSTTGNWFIQFSKAGCFHCKAFASIWEMLATKLKGEIPVATVDVSRSPETKKRFLSTEAESLPSLFLVKNGQAYIYHGAKDSPEKLEEFARGGFKTAKSFPIPKEASLVERLVVMLQEDLSSLYKFKKLALSTVFVVGVLVGFLLLLWVTRHQPKTKKH